MKSLKILFGIIFILIVACEESGRIDFIGDSPELPLQVTDLKVEPIPGGAKISYKIPDDPNLLYVKAVYEIQPSVLREVISSQYSDTLELIGYGDTLTHPVSIYSVGKNNKESAPIYIDVTPLSPPVQAVFNSIELNSTFGGANVTFKNESKAKLRISLMVDSVGHWETIRTLYTESVMGNFSVRGFDTEEYKFAVYVRDRWNNNSDTLFTDLTPLYEEEIPKSNWKVHELPTDNYSYVETLTVDKVFDGIVSRGSVFATMSNSDIPQWFTIDFGAQAILSRLVEHQRPGYTYNRSSVKRLEIWGSNDPAPDGSWDSWFLMGAFESTKPSGLPLGQTTPEDEAYAGVNGEEFEFEAGIEPVRYIRFKTVEAWGGGTVGQVVISEITFFGKTIN